MKRLITFLFFIVQFSILIAHDFHFSLEPKIGIKCGQISEFVFLKNSFYDDDKLSELNWEIKNEFFIGIESEIEYKGFFCKTQLSFGIPAKTGLMIDSDWLNVQIPNLENYQYKTNYSESNNFLEKDILIGIQIGKKIKAYENKFLSFYANPFIGFDYSSIKFTAKDGTAWYGKNLPPVSRWNDVKNSSISKLSGDVVSYERSTYIFWIGQDFYFDFSKFLCNLGFQIAPFIYSESIDTHFKRNKNFADKTAGFLSAYKLTFNAGYKINSQNFIMLNSDLFFTEKLRGDSYSKSTSKTKYSKIQDSDGGASENYFNISISWRYIFL